MKPHCFSTLLVAASILAAAAQSSGATLRYVIDGNAGALSPYTSWATAAASIQAAVDVSADGDTVLVTNGNYRLANNLQVTAGIRLASVNGAAATVIDGQGVTRCLYVDHANAVVDGFTVRGGYNPAGFGGAVDINSGGTVMNCILRDSVARDGGGAALDYGGLLLNCVICDNRANDNSSTGFGGGVRCLFGGTVRGCLIMNNTSRQYGGGVNIWSAGRVENCTVVSNAAPDGAGVRAWNRALVINSISFQNAGANWISSGSGNVFTNCCTTPVGSLPGAGNIATDPQFVSPAAGNYRLQAASPCINGGLGQAWMTGAVDLDGRTRVLGSAVDVGAYEFPPVVLRHITATSGANGAVAPAGVVAVTSGASQSFVFTPAPGYQIQSVLVDGVPVGTAAGYTFANVTADHTISVTFVPASWRKADFVIDSIQFSPSPLIPGIGFAATVVVRNQGDIQGEAGRLAVWLNKSALAVAGETGDVSTAVGVVQAGATKTVVLSSLTAPTATGTYNFRAFADCANVTAEKSEGNNQLTKTYTFTAAPPPPTWQKPDFVVSAIAFAPAPTPGAAFVATVTVRNQGTLAGNAGVLKIWGNRLALAATNDLADTSQAVGTLSIGGTKTMTFNMMAPATNGTFNFRAFADGGGLTTESSEGNNQLTKTYTFAAAAPPATWMKPDFVITSVSFSPAAPFRAGAFFTAYVTVLNQGDIPGDGGHLDVWLNGGPPAPSAAWKAIGSLNKGASVTIPVTLLQAPTAGWYNFRSMADSQGLTAEKSEGNNSMLKTYQVTP